VELLDFSRARELTKFVRKANPESIREFSRRYETGKASRIVAEDDPRRVTLLDTNVIDAQYRVGNDQVRARILILSHVTDAA